MKIIIFALVIVLAVSVAFNIHQRARFEKMISDLKEQSANEKSRLEADMKELQDSNRNSLLTASNSLAEAHAEIARLAPYVAKARQLPVTISRRLASIIGDGYVIQIKNKSSETLSLTVKVSKATSSKEFQIVLEEMMVKEIGKTEGWPAATGDTIEIQCVGYDPKTFTL